jgi:hypothetical protein
MFLKTIAPRFFQHDKPHIYFSNEFVRSIDKEFMSLFIDFCVKYDVKFAAFPINLSSPVISSIENDGKHIECLAPLLPHGRFFAGEHLAFYEFFETSDKWEVILNASDGLPIAVFFTKNDSGSNGRYSEYDRQTWRSCIFEGLRQEGFFVIIKPHPGEICLDKSLEKNQLTTDLPSMFLCAKADAVVFELPTNSIFDSIVCEKIPYLPVKLLEEFDLVDSKGYLEKMSLFMRRVVLEFCSFELPKKNEDNSLHPKIRRRFRQKYLVER